MDPIRYKELRAKCKKPGFEKKIREALSNDNYYGLEEWIFIHVTDPKRKTSSIGALQAVGLPCYDDTFRLYRAKFYYNLELIIFGDHTPKVPN